MARNRAELRGASRRDFIRFGLAAGGVLGLRPWQTFEVLEDTAGKALAAEAACLPTNRSVHLLAGSGGFAWFQLLWPHVEIAEAQSSTFAFHAPGTQQRVVGTDKPL